MHKLILIVLLFGLLSNYPSSLAAADSASYTYDSLGRLTTVTYANGTIITYSYDAMGNRSTVVTICGPNGC